MTDFESLVRKEIKGRYRFHPERGSRGEWCGVIYEIDGLGREKLLDVGIELNRRAIKDWINLAIRNKPWEPDGMPAPDHYDRAGIVKQRPQTLH